MRIQPYFPRVVPSFWEHGSMKAENGMNTEVIRVSKWGNSE